MGSVVGSILGNQAANRQMDDANRAREEALKLFASIGTPDLASQEVSLIAPQSVGDYQAILESANNLGPSAMEGISLDPRLQQAQMAALQQLSDIGQTGLTPAEAAALQQAQSQAQAQAQAKSAQLMQEFARRGTGGSGMELAARMQAAQGASANASAASANLMQQAQQRALQAISNQASLAGQIGQQQFGQQSDVARAKDLINQYNAANQQSVQQRNTQAQNIAAQQNLANRQNIANAAASTANQQQMHNKALIQQQFNNRMARAGGMAGQYSGIANAHEGQAGRTADMYAGIGRGVDTAIGTYLSSNKGGGNQRMFSMPSQDSGFSNDEIEAGEMMSFLA